MMMLVMEPLAEKGMRLRIASYGKWSATEELAHGQDIVVGINRFKRYTKKVEGIVVRSGVGTFSASRSALVAAQVLSAVWHVPVYFVSAPIETPADLEDALKHTTKTFAYERPPSITIKKA